MTFNKIYGNRYRRIRESTSPFLDNEVSRIIRSAGAILLPPNLDWMSRVDTMGTISILDDLKAKDIRASFDKHFFHKNESTRRSLYRRRFY